MTTLDRPRRPANDRGKECVVEAFKVTKSFGRDSARRRVLAGASLAVQRGECVFLVGPSGCGKTTLLSICGGLLRADGGRVRLWGRDVAEMTEAQLDSLRLRQIGFVFQRLHLIRGLTALDNVVVPLALQGISAADSQPRGQAQLEAVGLGDRGDSMPEKLSVGQCQRVAIARALVNDPELVLADEPTAALDARSGHQCMALLRELTAAAGKALVVVTHDPRIYSFADRICSLADGELRDVDPAQVPVGAL